MTDLVREFQSYIDHATTRPFQQKALTSFAKAFAAEIERLQARVAELEAKLRVSIPIAGNRPDLAPTAAAMMHTEKDTAIRALKRPEVL